MHAPNGGMHMTTPNGGCHIGVGGLKASPHRFKKKKKIVVLQPAKLRIWT